MIENIIHFTIQISEYNMNLKKVIVLPFVVSCLTIQAQSAEMNFPHFAGKHYDFTIFQGNDQKVIYKGIIPQNGKFRLTIPKEYVPYHGMSRWLITGTAEGGGLDMYIPGKDFSVSCIVAQPTEESIIYTNNTGNTQLSKLSREQQKILFQYEAMQQSLKAFTPTDVNYPVFQQEYQNQTKAYSNFQDKLRTNSDYISQFLQIVNITKGISPVLTEKEEEEEDKAKNIHQYIINELDWQVLYTSGFWSSIISTWINIHTQLINDPKQFAEDFRKISSKINSDVIYTSLAQRTAYYLSQKGQDEYIAMIAPMITGSGKISKFDGDLASYTKGITGSQAPDLIIPKDTNNKKQITKTLKTGDNTSQQTILFFYQSADCDECDKQLLQLKDNYQKLVDKGIHIITLSADKDKAEYNNKAKTFPWKDNYCDYLGVNGDNYKNYGVTGVPTLILIDANGKIISRGASINF